MIKQNLVNSGNRKKNVGYDNDVEMSHKDGENQYGKQYDDV